jgi:dienelactone hydrolase
MRRIVLCAAALALAAVACIPPDPGPTGLYLGVQPDVHPVVTARNQPVTWGAAPVIDANYGGTLYAGTALETADPRPPLLAGGLEPLRLWVADPHNGLANRAAIVWLHGGGFAVGIDSMYGLANDVGRAYAQRGYVGFSVEYRTDTTLVGSGARPPSLCQWVQDHVDPTSSVWVARWMQCRRNILAAQQDVQGAVRWLRVHAAEYGIDPNRIAAGGFSAGAVTAVNLAYRGDTVGTTPYFAGDDVSVAKSKVQAAFGASGCAYPDTIGGTTPSYIGAGDAPISLIQSKFDQAVPYACVANTVTTARAAGLVAELTSYCNSSLHAQALYDPNKAAADAQWTTFLARELHLYTGMRPPSADPVCP